MATFTMELRDILGVSNPYQADPAKIGLAHYPIWNEEYRTELNTKIVKRFWFREIGFETVEMFRFKMDALLCEIMPYYNKLAETTLINFDPFETLNIQNTHDASNTIESTGATDSEADSTTDQTTQEQSESTQHNTSENASRSVNSEHPQTRLNEFEDYATASTEAVSESASDSAGESSGSSTQQATERNTATGTTENQQTANTTDTTHQHGTQGNKSEMLQQYRDTILGIDTLILEELEVLFMGVWDTNQTYTTMENTHGISRLLF